MATTGHSLLDSLNFGPQVPPGIVAGTLHHDGMPTLWDVRDTSKPVAVDLKDDTYQTLVVEVIDPYITVDLIEHAVTRG